MNELVKIMEALKGEQVVITLATGAMPMKGTIQEIEQNWVKLIKKDHSFVFVNIDLILSISQITRTKMSK